MRNERSSNKVERNHRFFILSGNLELLVSSRSLVDLKQFYIVTFVLKNNIFGAYYFGITPCLVLKFSKNRPSLKIDAYRLVHIKETACNRGNTVFFILVRVP